MSEQESRYRKSRYTDPGKSREVRDRYKKAQHVHKSDQERLTYDEYVKSVKTDEKLFDIDEENPFERAGELFSKVRSRAKSKIKQYSPVVQKQIEGIAQKTKLNAAKTKRSAVPSLVTAGQTAKRLVRGMTASKKAVSVSVFVGIVVLTGIAISSSIGGDTDQGDEVAGQVQSAVDQRPVAPTFPVLESGTTQENQGVVFDPERGVAAFRDTVRGSTVTVSQQPLTSEQTVDPGRTLSEVATNLLAQGSFESNKGEVYYTIPGPDQDPSQTAMFIHKDLLIFIRTQGVSLDPQVWETYINSLR